MARQSSGAKAYRALDLLTGFGDPTVRRALEPYGLDKGEVDRGWALLRQLGEARRVPGPTADNDELLAALDAWENQWFVVCDVALARSFPDVRAWLFAGLARTSGPDLVVSVPILLDRIEKLGQGKPARLKEAKTAYERLRKRGLTSQVLGEAHELLGRLHSFSQVGEDYVPDRQAKAEQALWDWYLEWSGIARASLKDKRLLNHLGFGRPGRPRKGQAQRSGA